MGSETGAGMKVYRYHSSGLPLAAPTAGFEKWDKKVANCE